MYSASPFYIYREHIQTLTAIPATARYAAQILQSPEQVAIVQASIAEHASAARSRLLNACHRVLGRAGA
jgi:hypothetical protein